MLTRLLLTAVAVLGSINVHAAAGAVRSAPPSIKVLLQHDLKGAMIEVKGKYSLYDPRTNDHISTRFIGKCKYMEPMKDGLQWHEEFPGIHQLLIVPEKIDTTTLVEGIEYRGGLYIYDVEGKISIVNDVNIEDYLRSMLSTQNLEDLPFEALAAYVIAMRTNLYYLADHPKTNFWAIDAAQTGYQGNGVVKLEGPVNEAIKNTRYMVLSKSGEDAESAIPFPAYWEEGFKDSKATVPAAISLQDAAALSKKGLKAPQILAQAFPNTNLLVMYYAK